MRESLFETVVGLVVVAVAATFLVFSLNQRSSAAPASSYELHTRFRDAGGMGPGTDVILSGVKVGSITRVELEPQTLFAKVTFHIRKDVTLPKEYKAQVQTDSVLGGAHMGFTYMASDDGEMLGNYAPGDEVENVGGVGNIMSVISNAVAGNQGVNASPTPAPAAPTE